MNYKDWLDYDTQVEWEKREIAEIAMEKGFEKGFEKGAEKGKTECIDELNALVKKGFSFEEALSLIKSKKVMQFA